MAFVVPETHPTPGKICSNLLRIHTFIIQNGTAQKEFRIRTCNQGRVLLLTEDVSFFPTGVRLAFSRSRALNLSSPPSAATGRREHSVRWGPGRKESCFFSYKTEIYFFEHFWAHGLLFFIRSPLTSSFLFPSQLTIRKEFLLCPVFWTQRLVPVLKCRFLPYCELWLLGTKRSNSVAYFQEMGIATESPFSLPWDAAADSTSPCPRTCSQWLSNFCVCVCFF